MKDVGFSIPSILTNLYAAAIWQVLFALLTFAWARFTASTGRLSLRTRITTSTILISASSIAILISGQNLYVVIVVMCLTVIGAIQYILKDLSHVGLVNSFRSTEAGIGPKDSLRQVNRTMSFLGIGANKLSGSAEFVAAMERVRKSGGRMRFLLSTPNNAALSELAQKNGKEDQSYSGRVRESIREILHQSQKHGGGSVEVRLYELNSAFALPHFRLMFIDDRICLFSHIVWNDKEGHDNPQLLLRKRHRGAEAESLYVAYEKYFEDLWDSPETKVINDLQDPRLSI